MAALGRLSAMPLMKAGLMSMQTSAIGTGIAAVRGEIIGKGRDGLGVLAFGREHDAGLVDIDKQRDVVVAAPGGGLVDRHPRDSREIGARPGTLDVMVNDAPQPGVMLADQSGHGVDRHR